MATEQVSYLIRLRDQMSARLKKLGLSVAALTRRLKRGLASALKLTAGLLRGLRTAAIVGGAALAGVTFAAVRMGQRFLEAASSLEDTQIKFNAVFKGVEDAAHQMVTQISTDLGFGEGSVMEFMSTVQDTLVPMGIARDAATEMSAGVVSLAADLAVFYPGVRDTNDALNSLQSVMVGMNRSALRFGVHIDESKVAAKALELGLGGLNRELTQQEKVVARLALIMEGTADAQGALLRGSETFTVRTQQLNEAVTDLMEVVGEDLKNALNDAVTELGGVDGVLLIVETAFRGLSKLLIDTILPAITDMSVRLVTFIQAAGGAEKASDMMADGLGLAFKVAGDAIKAAYMVTLLFIQGLDMIVAVVKFVGGAVIILAGFLAEALVGAFYLVVKVVALFLEGLDSLVIFIKDIAIAAFQALVNTIADLIESIGEALIALSQFDMMPNFLGDAGSAAMRAAAGMRDFSGSLDGLKGGATVIAELGEAIDKFAEDDLVGAMDAVNRFTIAFAEMTVNEFGEDLARMGDRGREIQEIFDSLSQSTVTNQAEFEALRANIQAAIDAMGQIEIATPEDADRVEAMRQHMERLRGTLQALTADANQAGDAVGGVGDQSKNAAGNFVGFKGGVQQVQEQLGTMDEQMANMTAQGINAFGSGLASALTSVISGSMSAGEAFKQFASQFLIQIGQMILQTIILNALTGGTGGFLTSFFATGGIADGGLGSLTPLANGGTVSGGLGRLLPVHGYATGGPIVDKPHIALVGEGKHNEAVVPLPDGKSIPVDMNGGGGANVTVQVSAVDAPSVDKLFTERRETLTNLVQQALMQSREFRGAVGGA
jgi:methyl-accepting chemotaxis protein